MIVVRIRGGLANQMFQYALGRQLSIKHGVPLLLDINHYDNEQTIEKTIRNYGLDLFHIKGVIAEQQQVNESKGWYTNSLKRKFTLLANIILPYFKVNIIKETVPFFDINILKAPKNCYLDGFWQSERYFKTIRDTIISDFKCVIPPSINNSSYLAKISLCNSISIHVRRGDYVNNVHYNSVHQVLNIDYYRDAMDYIVQRVENPVFFVFSDDFNWVMENFNLPYSIHFVNENNSETAYEDLRLMQHCKHNIIANSTFSWWPAWLNENSNKIVIAPKKWYKKEKLENKDITPNSWIKI